jgi:hypothetical protein
MDSKDRRDAIEAADATGLVAGEELITNAETLLPSIRESFPAKTLRESVPASHGAQQTIGLLQAELAKPAPSRAAIEQHVGALRSVRELEATVANWFDSPAVQRIIADLTQIGL